MFEHEALAAVGHGRREERPGQDPEVGEQRIRRPAGIDIGHRLEEHREDDHEDEGRQDRPAEAERSLLVPRPQLPLGERPDELSRAPDLADGRNETHTAPEAQAGRRFVEHLHTDAAEPRGNQSGVTPQGWTPHASVRRLAADPSIEGRDLVQEGGLVPGLTRSGDETVQILG